MPPKKMPAKKPGKRAQRPPFKAKPKKPMSARDVCVADRAMICVMMELECSIAKIQEASGHAPSTILETWKTRYDFPDYKSLADRSRERDEGEREREAEKRERQLRVIARNLKKYPYMTLKERQLEMNLEISQSQLNKAAKELGITFGDKRRVSGSTRTALKKLTDDQAAARLAWCKTVKDWDVAKWRTVLWSGKCAVERGFEVQQWVWVRGGVDPNHMINMSSKDKSKRMRVTVAAMIWGENKRSELFIVPIDETSATKSVSSKSYRELLKEMLLPTYQPGQLFMQDKHPTHKAKMITDFLAEEKVEVLDWPSASRDLNPMEQLWDLLKKKTGEMFPEAYRPEETSPAARTALENALKEAWAAIPDETFDELVSSMPDRIAACIACKGR